MRSGHKHRWEMSIVPARCRARSRRETALAARPKGDKMRRPSSCVVAIAALVLLFVVGLALLLSSTFLPSLYAKF